MALTTGTQLGSHEITGLPGKVACFKGYLVLQADHTFFLEVLRLDSAVDGFLLTRVPPDRFP